MRDNICKHCYDDTLKEVTLKNHPSSDELNKIYGFTSIAYATIWRWLTYLCFKYDANRKVTIQMDMSVKMWLRIEMKYF